MAAQVPIQALFIFTGEFIKLFLLFSDIFVFIFQQRGEKICGNPCPICRDPNIIIHFQVYIYKCTHSDLLFFFLFMIPKMI